MASIGYGVMYPLTAYANAMVAIEALAGLMGLAGQRSDVRPLLPAHCEVLFSRVAVIVCWPTLMFRSQPAPQPDPGSTDAGAPDPR